ncbi:glucan endo-1,3-beta-glucosidase 13 [Canna indica]|uniref:Glucan endo-1,3-beta-glucosidase 13 n=1 Tax=Canna indica TaxID=4628 RepID=A0AAQ3QPI3_9LILI|nr:glucan endo-1,3-beta-glucosidase 13 [Canna indica]
MAKPSLVIKAFANTGVELMFGVPNNDLLPFSQYQRNIDNWLRSNILPYYLATMITYITVGAEITESLDIVSLLMFDAQLDSIFFALMALNFRTLKIMVTESRWPSKGAAKEIAATLIILRLTTPISFNISSMMQGLQQSLERKLMYTSFHFSMRIGSQDWNPREIGGYFILIRLVSIVLIEPVEEMWTLLRGKTLQTLMVPSVWLPRMLLMSI